jgi:pimeloyl-ACP methyl ester carboxylesterase
VIVSAHQLGNTTADIVAHNRTTVQIDGYDLVAILYKHWDDITPYITRGGDTLDQSNGGAATEAIVGDLLAADTDIAQYANIIALMTAYERPFRGVDGRLAYLRAARALRAEDLAARMKEVEKLDILTLIMWGAEDVFQPIRYGAQVAAAMLRARFEKVDQAGHFLPEDEPGIVARLIGDFVKSN